MRLVRHELGAEGLYHGEVVFEVGAESSVGTRQRGAGNSLQRGDDGFGFCESQSGSLETSSDLVHPRETPNG